MVSIQSRQQPLMGHEELQSSEKKGKKDNRLEIGKNVRYALRRSGNFAVQGKQVNSVVIRTRLVRP